MLVAELLFALVLALLVVVLFSVGLRRPGPWDGFLWFFLVVFLGAWAVAVWVEPVGPVAYGVAWLPILAGAFLIALLLTAIPPAARGPVAPAEEREATRAMGALGLFFWVFLLALVAVIGLAYAAA